MELATGNFSGGRGVSVDDDSAYPSPLNSRSRVDERVEGCEATSGGVGEDGPARGAGMWDAKTGVGVEISGGDDWFWMALNKS